MNRKYTLIGLISILLIASVGLAQSEYSQGLTPVPEELLEKLIMLVGEAASEFHGKDYTSYRMYPFYDLNGNTVGYEIMFYCGESEVPTDEELLEINEKIFEEDLSKEERVELLKERGLYKTISTVCISCCYELEPVYIYALGAMPIVFRHYALKKNILEEEFGFMGISFSDFKGYVQICGDMTYIKIDIDDEELYLNIFGKAEIFTKEDLLKRIKPIEEVFSEETIEENKLKWKEKEEIFDRLGLEENGSSPFPEGEEYPPSDFINECPDYYDTNRFGDLEPPYGVCYAGASSNVLSFMHNFWNENRF